MSYSLVSIRSSYKYGRVEVRNNCYAILGAFSKPNFFLMQISPCLLLFTCNNGQEQLTSGKRASWWCTLTQERTMPEVVTKLSFQAVSKRQDFENIMLLYKLNRWFAWKKNQINWKYKKIRGRNCISLVRAVLKHRLLLESELPPPQINLP